MEYLVFGLVPLFAALNRWRGFGVNDEDRAAVKAQKHGKIKLALSDVPAKKKIVYAIMTLLIWAAAWPLTAPPTLPWVPATNMVFIVTAFLSLLLGFSLGWGEYYRKPLEMSARWLYGFFPLFSVIWVFSESWWLAWAGLGLLALAGPLYALSFKLGYDNAPAEWWTGALLGGAVAVALI